MHSVSSNAVAKSLSYSTQEVKTGGTWIDGKPIYRKCWLSATNWANDTTIGTIQNMGTVVNIIDVTSFSGGGNYVNYGNDSQSVALTYVTNAGAVVVKRVGGFANNFPSRVIVEYTKTTD